MTQIKKPRGTQLKDAVLASDTAEITRLLDAGADFLGITTEGVHADGQPWSEWRGFGVTRLAIERGDEAAFDALVSHPRLRRHLSYYSLIAMDHAQGAMLKRLAELGVSLEEAHNLNDLRKCHKIDGMCRSGANTLLLGAIELDAKTGGHRVAALLEAGADPDGWAQKDPLSDPLKPLWYAVDRGHLPSVEALLAAGAKTEITDRDHAEFTPLGWAAWTRLPSIFKSLLEAGANPDVTVRNGEPLVHYLLVQTHPTQGAEFTTCFESDIVHRSMLFPLLKRPVDVAVRYHHETPLHTAARMGYNHAVIWLVEAGADVHALDANGMPPLWQAVHNKVANAALRPLLEAGADRELVRGRWSLIADAPAKEEIEPGSFKARWDALRERIAARVEDGTIAKGETREQRQELLAIFGYGLLPKILNALAPKENAYEIWKELRTLMPPYWQQKMNEMDTTALDRPEELHADAVARRREAPLLSGVRR